MTCDWCVQWWYDSVGDGMPLRLHEWAVRITISITLRKSEARCSTHRYCPSAHPRLKYRHSTSPESPTIVHIGVRHIWKIVSPDGCIDAVSIEMYRLTNTPALVTDAEIKSNEFDTIFGWKRCWHAWAKPTPASRFSHARQRFYRTIALLALHIPQTENKVLRTRSVGRSGGLDRQRKGKIPLFIPF